ncbi:unnamed protein product [Sphenostylis stenocarpa]|uniref:Pre-mRNA-splicing factor SLU7 n=1 Tax=Sphenostylis stenocarpa TaxID=92480 RepID=A0AA86W124_9FABA|nr:unnamed protein product [Sphenostylis stenocarpa]
MAEYGFLKPITVTETAFERLHLMMLKKINLRTSTCSHVAATFKSREDHSKQLELEEPRKAGLAPAEVDEDGTLISPSAKIFQADTYRKGACENCGARTHNAKLCMERPRKTGAKWINMHIAPDDKIETFELDYDGKRDHGMEDIAKYLLNLDVNSAYYGPKTGSMRQDPLPDVDPNEKFYGVSTMGRYQYRMSGQALEFKHLNIHAWESFEKGQDIHMQAAPSQAELLYKKFKIIKEKLKSQPRKAIMEKYGNAAAQEELSKELLLGQTERQTEYDRAGRIINGLETSLPNSKYEEDVYINNHTSVWGSRWKDHQWGYKCCKQTIRNSYCTGTAGIEGAEAVANLMKTNIERKAASEGNLINNVYSFYSHACQKINADTPVPAEEKSLATWGTDVPDDLVLDQKKLAEALKKEDERKREEKDNRKRKYNVRWNNEVKPIIFGT